MPITNVHSISLPLAIWLLYDDYDYRTEPNYISATSLLKSVKQAVLGKRVPKGTRTWDISDNISSRFGTALHDAIEKAWRNHGQEGMKMLGYPDHIARNIFVNPTDEMLAADPKIIPIWLERRSTKEFEGYLIGGKFDQAMDGRLFDTKSTSVWTYLYGSKEEDYILQGSIYRWLNQDIITEDHIYINYLFTDWQKSRALNEPDYPKIRIKEVPYKLMSIPETERWMRAKLQELSRCWNLPEEELPECNDKELWRSEPTYKYYADPNKTNGRSSKNFDNIIEAQSYLSSKGSKGVIKTVPGEPKACEYCPAFSICKQKDAYYA